MSCDIGAKLMPMDDALEMFLKAVPGFDAKEYVPISSALGRVLATDQVANIDVPPADNSAMDGYAVNTKSLEKNNYSLVLSQRIPAGYASKSLVLDTAARIFTGAEVPEGADAVVMQEKCELDGDAVCFPKGVRIGQNIRRCGQDVSRGVTIVPAGTRLQPQHLGLLASVGISEIPVFKPLKVAVLSTGDELVEPGDECDAGQIYNSNRYALIGLIGALGMEFVDLGIVEDTLEATKAALCKAAKLADCIITSGGVSVGEEDHVKPAVEQLGTLSLWKIAIKPGKPVAFGEVLGVPLIGLPGNPVATFVTFCLLARPFLLKYQRALNYLPQSMVMKADFEVKKASIRREYLRAQVITARGGDSRVKIFDNQSSGVLTSTCWAHGFAVVPANTVVNKGDNVEFLHYSELLF